MLRRHSDYLENCLEMLAESPIVKLSKRGLRIAYGAERLSKNSFRDLFERLPENVELDSLSVLQDGDDVYLIRNSEIKEASSLI